VSEPVRLGAAIKVFSNKMLGSLTDHASRKDAVDVESWAAQYDTRLLIKLTPNCVLFSILL